MLKFRDPNFQTLVKKTTFQKRLANGSISVTQVEDQLNKAKLFFNINSGRLIAKTNPNINRVNKTALNVLKKSTNIKDEVNLYIGNVKSMKDSEKFFKQVNNVFPDSQVLIKFSQNKMFALKPETIKDIINNIEAIENMNTSDGDVVSNIRKMDYITIKRPEYTKKNRSGGFFPYYNKTNLDLYDLGIYHEDINEKVYEDNCLIVALRSAGIDENDINKVKICVSDSYVSKCKLKEIANIIGKNIILTSERIIKKNNDNTTKTFTDKYGKFKESIKIGLLENHYFHIKKINTCKFAIKNYEEIKDITNWNYIYKKIGNKFYKDEKVSIDSTTLIKTMIEQKDKVLDLITVNNGLMNTQYFKPDCKKLKISSLEYDEDNDVKNITDDPDPKSSGFVRRENNFFYLNNVKYDSLKKLVNSCIKTKDDKIIFNHHDRSLQKTYFYKKKLIIFKPIYKKIFFDFETIVEDEHKPYLCCFETKEGFKKSFNGFECGLNMLNYIKNKLKYQYCLMIAHNLRYDFSFLAQYLQKLTPILKNSKLMTCGASFYGMNIKLKDSYTLITMPLSKFPKTFGLEGKKEIMPYGLYTKENVIKKYINIDDIKNYIYTRENSKYLIKCENTTSDEFFKAFKQNCESWKLLNKNGTVDIIEYSRLYCEIDCKILKNGYEKFRGWINDVCDLDIDEQISSASLAHNYFIKQECYEDVKMLGGVPRVFIEKCIVGGRTMSKLNQKIHTKNKRISDFDAVSLYPSAMYELGGYLKGLPKIIEDDQKNFNFLKKQDGYFVECLIKKVGIKRNFPLMSVVNNEGVRYFNNEMENQIMYLDKIACEDLMKFQKVELEVLQGYYFNEGRNNKVKEVIKYLFDTRKKEKANDNPIQEIYKLIMNSSYGKTILKAIDKDTKVIHNDKLEEYIGTHYNHISGVMQKVGENWFIDVKKSVNEHFNLPHIGTEILSMSKRIMNRVMSLAEDNAIDIYYQDTDSMHINENDLSKLEKIYEDTYNKKLVGKDLGQFHSDFDFKGCKNVYSKELIILGKKCYLDHLVGTDKITGKKKESFHMRMKGVSSKSILYTCDDVKETYLKALHGKKISFDLTCNGFKPCFKANKDMTMTTLSDFTRELQFKGPVFEY